jgi:hypothetical protein
LILSLYLSLLTCLLLFLVMLNLTLYRYLLKLLGLWILCL